MKQTIAEKILSRAAGRPVHAGEDVEARPDFVLTYPLPGFTEKYLERLKEEFGVDELDDPSRFAVFIDHNIPSTSARAEAQNIAARQWGERNGVAVHERKGIGHLVAAEAGYAVPGAFVVHFDGHVSQLGAFGTLAIGLHLKVLEAYVSPTVALRVPATTRVDFEGMLQPGVSARDVLHHLTALLGSDGCSGQVLELGGPGLAAFSTGDIQGMAGMAMFTGALTAIANPSPGAIAYASERARISLPPVASDDDAIYAARHVIRLDELEPTLVLPPHPANVARLEDHLGMTVDVGYIGSCASGRMDDLRAAASILKGRKIKPGFVLNIIPSSAEIMAQASREGVLATLIEAGAYTSSPSCSFCYGAMGGMVAGQRALSTGTLNVRGRMGSVDADIYLASPLTIAAAALEGRVVDPRDYVGEAAA